MGEKKISKLNEYSDLSLLGDCVLHPASRPRILPSEVQRGFAVVVVELSSYVHHLSASPFFSSPSLLPRARNSVLLEAFHLY